jgi:hypothetical protein
MVKGTTTVADLERAVARADLDDLAHRLMTDDIAAFHPWDDAVVDMEIGAANGAGGHLDDGVARMLDLGVGHRVEAHIAFAVPAQGFHRMVRAGAGRQNIGDGGLQLVLPTVDDVAGALHHRVEAGARD